jgi:hypothetical protein
MDSSQKRIELPLLQDALRQRAQSWKRTAIAQIAGGLAATVLIPAIAAVFMSIGFHRVTGWGMRHGALEWTTSFILAFVVFMPVAYFLEWQTQGGFLMKKLWEIEHSDGGWYEAVTRDRTWRWDARAGIAEWEILLFAPRMVFGGFAKLRGTRLLAGADPARTAEILGLLLGSDHGIEIATLRRRGEDQLALSRAISSLLFYDWVGVSENGQKIWALTASRKELNAG